VWHPADARDGSEPGGGRDTDLWRGMWPSRIVHATGTADNADVDTAGRKTSPRALYWRTLHRECHHVDGFRYRGTANQPMNAVRRDRRMDVRRMDMALFVLWCLCLTHLMLRCIDALKRLI